MESRRSRRNRVRLTDPEWLAARAKTEEDGQIVGNIVNQLLVPTAFSAMK